MPLASGADVKIGAYEFMLSTEDGSYLWVPENLFPTTSEIIGDPEAKSANQNVLLWSYDNFIAGDGLKYYDASQPARWHTGNNNPRAFPGAIQGPPTRAQDTLTTDVTPTTGFFSAAQGRLWYASGQEMYHSQDGDSWAEATAFDTALTADIGTDGRVISMCSDGNYVYAYVTDGTNAVLYRMESTTVATTVVTVYVLVAGLGGLLTDIAVREGFLYGWTGTTLYRIPIYDSTTFPITASTSLQVAKFDDAATGTQYTGMINAGESLVYFRAYEGNTVIYETKTDPQTNVEGHRMFWEMVNGFTAKKIAYNSGVLFILGDYQDKIGLWGYSMRERQPLFLGYVGEAVDAVNTRFLCGSYGAQMMMGVDDGTTNYIYIYDAEEDSFSQLDERTIANDGTMTAGFTYKDLRLQAGFATTSTDINQWQIDTASQTGSWDWDSAAYDFGYPHEEKVLLGFHVIQDPTIATGTINVDYQVDEDGVWLDAGTTTAAQGHNYITVSSSSSTKKFRTLRMRMTGANGCRGFSITARAYVNTKQDVWKLKLDMSHEPGTERHPSDRTYAAEKLRDNLRTLVSNGNVVEFQDGTRRRRKSGTVDTGYTSHTVLVEFPKGSVDSGREGVAEVILRSVAPSA